MISEKIEKKLRNLPQQPGIYIFKDEHGKILYIGKAANLKSRVRSYFSGDYAPYSPAKSHLVEGTANIEIKKTPSEIEALIFESELIKRKRPKYNVVFRDDKNYFFVGITTKEDFPRIFITHQPTNLKNQNSKIKTTDKNLKINKKSVEYIGPFTDGGSLKRVLRILRGIFPYYTGPHPKNRKCTYCHIDLCPGPDPDRAMYRKTIRNITEILKGKRTRLLATLKKEMKKESKAERFEQAAAVRDQIEALENIFAHGPVVSSPQERKTITLFDVAEYLKRDLDISISPRRDIRIEGYDISNIQGGSATGSMVVFTGSKRRRPLPNKNGYRKFRIKSVMGANDVAMIKEVLRRRFNHPEWPKPDIILIDGGRAQLNAARAAIDNLHVVFNIPIIALAKREEEIYLAETPKSVRLPKDSPLLHLFMYIRDEAHRFAIGYHRVLRKKKAGF